MRRMRFKLNTAEGAVFVAGSVGFRMILYLHDGVMALNVFQCQLFVFCFIS
jgi:hypothetical protein